LKAVAAAKAKATRVKATKATAKARKIHEAAIIAGISQELINVLFPRINGNC
jgi:hypothetical protein